MTADARRRGFLVIAGLSGALAVGLGAYAAHGLSGVAQEWADKASRYQMYHALALLAVARLQRPGARLAAAAGVLFILGTVLFCGALYAMAILGAATAPVAPFGGTSFILGWLALAVAALSDPRPPGV